MALTGNGTLYTWGGNDAGQLGYTTQGSFQSTPRRVGSGAQNYGMVSAGQKHSVALGIDGSVWCWGANNEGQIGNGLTSEQGVSVPTNPQLPPGSIASDIAAGFAHVLVVLGGGQTIYAWGSNLFGQLGDGSLVSKGTPVSITLPSGVQPDGITKVVAGSFHSLALLKRYFSSSRVFSVMSL
jgi:alpha-tubulin suppressor-like RCC1 family protein